MTPHELADRLEQIWLGCENVLSRDAETLEQAVAMLRSAPEPVACTDGTPCKHGSWCTEVYCQEASEFRKPPPPSIAARERERIAKWLETEHKQSCLFGPDFAAAIRALEDES